MKHTRLDPRIAQSWSLSCLPSVWGSPSSYQLPPSPIYIQVQCLRRAQMGPSAETPASVPKSPRAEDWAGIPWRKMDFRPSLEGQTRKTESGSPRRTEKWPDPRDGGCAVHPGDRTMDRAGEIPYWWHQGAGSRIWGGQGLQDAETSVGIQGPGTIPLCRSAPETGRTLDDGVTPGREAGRTPGRAGVETSPTPSTPGRKIKNWSWVVEYKVTFVAHLRLWIEVQPTTNKHMHTQRVCTVQYSCHMTVLTFHVSLWDRSNVLHH